MGKNSKAGEEFTPKELQKVLARLPLFDGIEPDLREEIAHRGKVRRLERGQVYLEEGAPVEDLGILLAGEVELSRAGTFQARLHRGDTIGDLNLLGNLPSFFAAVVRHDAVLFVLPHEFLREVLEKSATFAVNLMRQASRRLAAVHVTEHRRRTLVIAVFSGPAGVGKTRFAANLAAALMREIGQPTLLIDVTREERRRLGFFSFSKNLPLLQLKNLDIEGRDIAGEKGQRHEEGFEVLRVVHRSNVPEDAAGVSPLLSSLSGRFRHIIVDLPPVMDGSTWEFLEHADVTVVISSPRQRDLDRTTNLLKKLPGDVRVVLSRVNHQDRARLEEIEERLGGRVAETLEELPEEETMAVVNAPETRYSEAVRRTARFLTGRAVGVALSAGAARGTAHVGVLRVLEEEGIPVDLLAGTSIGAVIAGMWAAGRTAAALERMGRRLRRRDFFSFWDLSFPPSASLMRGRKIDAFVDRVFGEILFPELRIPLRVVAADVDTGHEIVIDRGKVGPAVRGSMSIPGVLPPVEWKGRRLIDGAVVRPVPVQVLRDAGVKRIIAVNAIPTLEAFRSVEPPGRKRVFRKKKPLAETVMGYSDADIPNIVDIIVRAHQFLESAVAEETCEGAGVVICPWLPELHWVDFDSAPRFIEAGARATRALLPEIRNLVG